MRPIPTTSAAIGCVLSPSGQESSWLPRASSRPCPGLLRSLLGFPQLAFAPQDARQVEVGLAVRRQRGGLPVVLDRLRRLVGEIVRLPQRHVGLVVGLDHALLHALLDHRDAFLLAALGVERSEEHTSELQSLMRISYAVFCLKK